MSGSEKGESEGEIGRHSARERRIESPHMLSRSNPLRFRAKKEQLKERKLVQCEEKPPRSDERGLEVPAESAIHHADFRLV